MIAPDLPGFGESDVLPTASFPAYGQAISELLDRLAIGPRYIYLHDFGAPVGFHIAMQDLPRMEAHILDGGHMLLETHAAESASLMVDFIKRNPRERTGRPWMTAHDIW